MKNRWDTRRFAPLKPSLSFIKRVLLTYNTKGVIPELHFFFFCYSHGSLKKFKKLWSHDSHLVINYFICSLYIRKIKAMGEVRTNTLAVEVGDLTLSVRLHCRQYKLQVELSFKLMSFKFLRSSYSYYVSVIS